MRINYSTSSGVKIASSQILVGSGALHGVDLSPPTTGQSTLTVYDSENSTILGKLVLAEVYVDAGLATVNHEYFNPVCVNRGIYTVFSGNGNNYIIRYIAG